MYRIIGADGWEYGPVQAEQLRQWIAEGRANAQTRVVCEGAAEWALLGTLPEFACLFAPQPAIPTATPQIRKTNSSAMTGMILGILALTFGWCCCYGFPFNVPGIVFSAVGLAQVKNNPHLYDGKGMAIAGLILCIVSLVLAGILMVISFATGLHNHRFMWEMKTF